jgi:hypothetical protein
MANTCRAAVFRGDETYEIREFPIPDPPPGGAVRTDVVAGEVFDLDGIDEAMGLLSRADPTRDAVRVGLRHSHGGAS